MSAADLREFVSQIDSGELKIRMGRRSGFGVMETYFASPSSLSNEDIAYEAIGRGIVSSRKTIDAVVRKVSEARILNRPQKPCSKCAKSAHSCTQCGGAVDLANDNEAMFVPPVAARAAAKKAMKWRLLHGDEVKAMTRTGWVRANQIASGKPLSLAVVRRMAAFRRHESNSKIAPEFRGTPWKDRGHVCWLGWGGDAGIAWAEEIVNSAKCTCNKCSNKTDLANRPSGTGKGALDNCGTGAGGFQPGNQCAAGGNGDSSSDNPDGESASGSIGGNDVSHSDLQKVFGEVNEFSLGQSQYDAKLAAESAIERKQAKQRIVREIVDRLDQMGISEADITDDLEMAVRHYARVDPRDKLPKGFEKRTALVTQMINKWAATSGDSDAMATGVQKAIKAELERDFPELKNAPLDHVGDYSGVPNSDRYYADEKVIANHKAVRAVIRAQYNNTQQWLEDRKIKNLVMHRGVRDEAIPFRPGEQLKQNVLLQPASSFSMNRDVALSFSYAQLNPASRMVLARIPASRILSTAGTGFGCLVEQEVVVLGGTMEAFVEGPMERAVDKLEDGPPGWTQLSNKASQSSGDNCGTGSGGFQPGNDCAKGKSGNGSGKSKKEKKLVLGNWHGDVDHPELKKIFGDDVRHTTLDIDGDEKFSEEEMDLAHANRKEKKQQIAKSLVKRIDAMGITEDDISDEMIRTMNRGFEYKGHQVPEPGFEKRTLLVEKMIDNWAVTSGNGDPTAVGIQMAVIDELQGDIPELKAAQTDHLGLTYRKSNYALHGGKQAVVFEDEVRKSRAVRAVIRAQYDNTQDMLKTNGISEIVLHRGIQDSRVEFDRYDMMDTFVTLQPASSFSTSRRVADGFAFGGSEDPVPDGRIMSIQIPARLILGNAGSGFGCLPEQEVVVLGGRMLAQVEGPPAWMLDNTQDEDY